jgi:thiamine kinase-like enzyme
LHLTDLHLTDFDCSISIAGLCPVAVHGDLWTSNLLWSVNDKSEAGDELCAIIDWQMTHPGNCCEDIGRLLVSSVSGKLRRQHTDHVLQVYHQKLTEASGGVAPFTLEQVQQAYKAIFPYSVLIMMFGVPMYINIGAIVDGPTKSDRQEQLLLRARNAMEDAIELLTL